MEPFTARVVDVILGIPSGKVMTYGQIAKLSGSSKGARQVVRVLHSMSRAYQLPWHRVINIKGELSLADESRMIQKLRLQSEGIDVTNDDRIDLKRYQYHPEPPDTR